MTRLVIDITPLIEAMEKPAQKTPVPDSEYAKVAQDDLKQWERELVDEQKPAPAEEKDTKPKYRQALCDAFHITHRAVSSLENLSAPKVWRQLRNMGYYNTKSGMNHSALANWLRRLIADDMPQLLPHPKVDVDDCSVLLSFGDDPQMCIAFNLPRGVEFYQRWFGTTEEPFGF